MKKEYLNTNIKFLRKKNNLTQEAFAQIICVARETVLRYENNTMSPCIEIIKKIHECFNISIDDLLYTDLSKDIK